jgi:putative CocE/NonD family hydrolase
VNRLRRTASSRPLAALALLVLTAPSHATAPVVLEPKYEVRVEHHVTIPMRDGVKLSADLIRPARDGRFPVIIEYIPYRKDDLTRGGYDAHHYFAERGFIGVRLDVRGTGSSEGVNTDEYMPIEQSDGFDAVEWCARQPWSNGNVGMFGTSYGGFTCIQVAMHRPPNLKAIAPMYATDDRFTDDCHYTPGGNMRLYYDVGTYGNSMIAMNALPPVLEYLGPQWAEMWRQRLEENEPYLLKWMAHQVDGPYWRAASLRPDYDRIACPVFLVAGWRDGYANAMLRTYTHLKVPKKLLIGPWVHQRPNVSTPGPRIDYLNEVARFFAHWLRQEDTGIMKEPAVTAYMQTYREPERTLAITPGAWRPDADFPSGGASELTLHLQEGDRLGQQRAASPRRAFDEFTYEPTVGLGNGYWSAGGMSFYLADDQREDEARSRVYTAPPLDRELHLLGWPRVILHAASSAKVATFVAKLADVAPDGHSALIVDGSLNATRRRSLTDPEPLTPGEVYELNIPMNPTGWILPAGHRLRLAISGSDFPNLWPTPERAQNRVYRDGSRPSRVVLPVVPASTLEPPRFLPPPRLTPYLTSFGSPPIQQVLRDQVTGAVTVVNRTGGTAVIPDGRGTMTTEQSFRCTASSRDPAQADIVGAHTYVLTREDGAFEVTSESTIRATATAFHVTINLTVTRNGKPFFHKRWMVSQPRRLL